MKKYSALKLLALLLLAIPVGALSQSATPLVPASPGTSELGPGFRNESEVGIVVSAGNTRTQTYNLRQLNTYTFDANLVKFQGGFLRTSSDGVETARLWSLGLRYERALSDVFSLFIADTVENNRYAGLDIRDAFDVGAKYFFVKTDPTLWFAELGYRLTREKYSVGDDATLQYARAYSELNQKISETVSGKVDVEYLPNFSESTDYQMNGEAALAAAMNSIFSVKVAYLVRYDHLPVANAQDFDALFTASLLAKF